MDNSVEKKIKEKDPEGGVNALKEELVKVRQELRDVHIENRDLKVENATLKSSVQHQETLNKEKTQQIAELQRANTVQLWEKEKERLLGTTGDKLKNLEDQVKTLNADKASLQTKLQHFETKLGAEKLKKEIKENLEETHKLKSQPQSNQDNLGSLQLRQHVYVLEKDLKKVDSELHSQQKHIVGLLNGLNTDYNTTFKKILESPDDRVDGLEENTVIRIKLLKKTIKDALDLAKEGKLAQVCANLPDYYVALDRDIENTTVRKISMGYNTKGLAPVKTSTMNGFYSEGDESKLPDNPEIVDRKTGNVNHIMLLRHFPHFTKSYIQEQFDHFKSFDTNGDGSLDMTEVLTAMNKNLGEQFTAPQIKEAMLEVDVDGDHTIDFFEYLKVADMLNHKSGQSDVFRSDLVKAQGRNLSKTCLVM